MTAPRWQPRAARRRKASSATLPQLFLSGGRRKIVWCPSFTLVHEALQAIAELCRWRGENGSHGSNSGSAGRHFARPKQATKAAERRICQISAENRRKSAENCCADVKNL